MKHLVIVVGFFDMSAVTVLFLVDLGMVSPDLDWLVPLFFLGAMWGFQIIR
jgi:hypothetical protein